MSAKRDQPSQRAPGEEDRERKKARHEEEEGVECAEGTTSTATPEQKGEQEKLAKEKKKEDRISEVLQRMAQDTGDGDGPTVASMTQEQRENRWGFSQDELKAATKVAHILFSKPQLYVGDPFLAESRLYTMISRDRKVKRENKETFSKVMNEEKSRKERKMREEDVNTMRKTQMKRERDAALNKLLLAPEEDEDIPLICDVSGPGSGSGASAATAGGQAAASVDGEAAKKSGESENMKVHNVRKCHTCKKGYKELHQFYYSLCPPCGIFNFGKRMQSRNLEGKYILMTGCRIKIGYEMSLSLLRNGAILIATTRFANDAVSRFQQESDYKNWSDRLHLFSLDLRDLWMVTQFCGFLQTKYPFLFAIINNAAQTIARTPEYTERLREQEVKPTPEQIEAIQGKEASGHWRQFFMANSSVAVGQPLTLEYHPDDVKGKVFDGEEKGSGKEAALAAVPTTGGGDGEQTTPKEANDTGATTKAAKNATARLGNSDAKLTKTYDRYDTVFELSDQRKENSWTMNMGEITGSEASECMAINALAPFILNSKLKPMLLKDDPAVVAAWKAQQESKETLLVGDDEQKQTPAGPKRENRFIINVSAMEGQFYRYKSTTHPHTNMAKAALNMMTRTSGADYARDGIFINSVDTGWITDESPLEKKERRGSDFQQCPLDEVDAAARCLDLIYTDSKEHSQFFKDYHPIPW